MIDAFPALLSVSLFDQITPAARFVVALAAGSIACVFLFIPATVRRRRLKCIPIRIHVAGTRGKSAVTRLVAAGLRAGGKQVLAKTTGTQPKLILPDGGEEPVRRWGAASIREQSRFIRTAVHSRADAIVVEAMAIEPEYLGALERFYVRATDFVITNVRADHQEQLGEDPNAMALAIAHALPPGGRVFVMSEAATPVLREKAERLKCKLSVVEHFTGSDPDAANLALARAICGYYSINSAAAEAAMVAAQKDIGAFSLQRLTVGGRSIHFANAFSCNDVESFRRLWQLHQPPGLPAAFLFNARADRPLRSRAFLSLLPQLSAESVLYVTQGSSLLRQWAMKAGFDRSRIHLLKNEPAQDQLSRIARDIAEGTIVWGIGNFQGAGADITAFVNHAGRLC